MSDQDLQGAVRWLQANHVADGEGRQWVQWLEAQHQGAMADPARHSAETLCAFMEAVQEGLPELVGRNAKRREQALQALADALGESQEEQSLLRLLRLTSQHQHFATSFACLGYRAKPARLKRQGQVPENVEDLLLAVDCEMVAAEGDDNALARVCVCNARGQVLMDRLVKPKGKVTDPRTAITGIEAKDLEDLDFDRSAAQAELAKLMGPHTVMVGHTLHRDLDALRMDALLIFDISLLYGIQGQPKRRPALAHLVQEVLGRGDFRSVGGSEVHDCVQDVLMTMEIALHRLRNQGAKGPVPATVWVAAPQGKDGEAERKLYFHRMPKRDDVFQALSLLLAKLPVSMESLQLIKGQEKFIAAEVLFSSKEQAEAALLALPGENVEIDQAQRVQKVVRLHFPERAALIFVRPPLAGIGKACLEPPKPTQLPEAAATKMWKGKGWPGWRRAAEEALKATPSKKLHWKSLVSQLAQRRRLQGGGSATEAAESEEILEIRALAALPEEFVGDDAYVRLPQ